MYDAASNVRPRASTSATVSKETICFAALVTVDRARTSRPSTAGWRRATAPRHAFTTGPANAAAEVTGSSTEIAARHEPMSGDHPRPSPGGQANARESIRAGAASTLLLAAAAIE